MEERLASDRHAKHGAPSPRCSQPSVAMPRLLISLALITLAATGVAAAQFTSERIARGDSAYQDRRVPEALAEWQAALQADSTSYAALWRAAQAEVDLAEYDSDVLGGPRRFQAAEEYARGAVRIEPKRVEGHFALARVLGRAADHSDNPTDRVRWATEVHREAQTCLELAPAHAGCLHVLGEWHAHVAQLGSFERGWANSLAGSDLFAQGSWPEAERCLAAAAKREPRRLIHHLALGRVYAATGRPREAGAQFKAVLDGAVADYNDPRYKEEAKRELDTLGNADGVASPPGT
jgi:tetratricopeptide (TPR) repeat protein